MINTGHEILIEEGQLYKLRHKYPPTGESSSRRDQCIAIIQMYRLQLHVQPLTRGHS